MYKVLRRNGVPYFLLLVIEQNQPKNCLNFTFSIFSFPKSIQIIGVLLRHYSLHSSTQSILIKESFDWLNFSSQKILIRRIPRNENSCNFVIKARMEIENGNVVHTQI